MYGRHLSKKKFQIVNYRKRIDNSRRSDIKLINANLRGVRRTDAEGKKQWSPQHVTLQAIESNIDNTRRLIWIDPKSLNFQAVNSDIDNTWWIGVKSLQFPTIDSDIDSGRSIDMNSAYLWALNWTATQIPSLVACLSKCETAILFPSGFECVLTTIFQSIHIAMSVYVYVWVCVCASAFRHC